MIARMKDKVQGTFQRELLPGTLTIRPIQDHGALARGEHAFGHDKPAGTHPCEGRAGFTIVCRQQRERWTITRAFGDGH